MFIFLLYTSVENCSFKDFKNKMIKCTEKFIPYVISHYIQAIFKCINHCVGSMKVKECKLHEALTDDYFFVNLLQEDLC